MFEANLKLNTFYTNDFISRWKELNPNEAFPFVYDIHENKNPKDADVLRYGTDDNSVVVTLIDNPTNEILEKLNDSIDVNLQDQTTDPIIGFMSAETASSTLAVQSDINNTAITVVDGTDFEAGDYLSIFSIPDNRVYLARVLTKNVNILELDTPLDFAFPIGAFVTGGNTNLAVNGSVTPVIYGLRNTEEAIGSTFDITRVMFTCLMDSAGDLSTFGDIENGLSKGIVFRHKNGRHLNIFNAKTNGDLSNLMYDFQILSSINPAQGQNGFVGRLTFASQGKIGVALRIEPGEDLQMIIQDNLTDLTLFSVIVEGHVVE